MFNIKFEVFVYMVSHKLEALTLWHCLAFSLYQAWFEIVASASYILYTEIKRYSCALT